MLDKQVIIDGDKLIAKFLGWELSNKGKKFKNYLPPYGYVKAHPDFLKFNISLDWLILAVEKIEEMDNIYFEIVENSCYVYDIYTFTDDYQDAFIIKNGNTKLEAIWLTVVEFIKCYNKNKNL